MWHVSEFLNVFFHLKASSGLQETQSLSELLCANLTYDFFKATFYWE